MKTASSGLVYRNRPHHPVRHQVNRRSRRCLDPVECGESPDQVGYRSQRIAAVHPHRPMAIMRSASTLTSTRNQKRKLISGTIERNRVPSQEPSVTAITMPSNRAA